LEDERKHRAKLLGWMSVGCAVALICACLSPRALFAEATDVNPSASTSKTRDIKSKPKTQTSHPRKHLKKPASKTITSRRRAHPPSQLAADKQPLSTTATAKAKARRGKARRKTVRGQQKIDSERAQAIQAALIREHYLSGTATGTWNQSSEDAMRRYQADHGWQSKTVPDSRALISLGLGPSHDHLLNPESAMTTGPSAPRAASLTPASHSADPGTRMNTPPAATSDHDASGPQ
jgi:Putative peptidoglycan binding domain